MSRADISVKKQLLEVTWNHILSECVYHLTYLVLFYFTPPPNRGGPGKHRLVSKPCFERLGYAALHLFAPGSSSINLTSCKTKDQASKWWKGFPSWISRKKENPHDNVVKLYFIALKEWKAIIGAKLPPSANRPENYSTVHMHVVKWPTKISSVVTSKGKQRTQTDRKTSLQQGNGIRPCLTDYWRIWTSSKEIVCFTKLVPYSRCISASFTSLRWRGAKLGLCEFSLERNMPEE